VIIHYKSNTRAYTPIERDAVPPERALVNLYGTLYTVVGVVWSEDGEKDSRVRVYVEEVGRGGKVQGWGE